MYKKKNHNQGTECSQCGKIAPLGAFAALPVMMIILMEKLKLL